MIKLSEEVSLLCYLLAVVLSLISDQYKQMILERTGDVFD